MVTDLERSSEWCAAWAALDDTERAARNIVAPTDRLAAAVLIDAVQQTRRRLAEVIERQHV